MSCRCFSRGLQAAAREAARHEVRCGELASITHALRSAAQPFVMPEYWHASSLLDTPRRHVSRCMIGPLQTMLRATAKKNAAGDLLDAHAQKMRQIEVRYARFAVAI